MSAAIAVGAGLLVAYVLRCGVLLVIAFWAWLQAEREDSGDLF